MVAKVRQKVDKAKESVHRSVEGMRDDFFRHTHTTHSHVCDSIIV